MSVNRIAVLTLVCLLTTAWTLAAENTQESRTGSLLAAIEKSCRARGISPGHGHKVLPVAQAILKIKDRISEIKGADPMLSQVAALLHDIGGGGLPGETKGPPIAKEILTEQKCDPAMIERVCRIIATHHHLKGNLDISIGERPEWLLVIIADRPDVIRQYEAAPQDAESLERDVNAWIVKLNRDIRWKVEPTASPQQLLLWPGQAPVGDGKSEAANTTITVHLPPPEKANGAALVICPGGGYGGLVVGPEGHGIAKWLNGYGIAGIVLEYRLPHGRAFVPLLDAQRAIRTTRFNAKRWGIDPGRIGIIGFSAGGHLASTAGTHFDDGEPKATDPVNRVSCRPDFAILIYPVVTLEGKGHRGTRQNLLGPDPKPDMVALFSNEKQVTRRTPPMFLAHAKDDTVVPPENSRMLFEALKAHGVAAEYLELPRGGHGLNGYKGPMWDAWQTKSLEWLKAQKK